MASFRLADKHVRCKLTWTILLWCEFIYQPVS